MAITDPFILPEDVVFTEIASLPADLRRRVTAAPGDRIVTRPRVRAWSKLLDADAATLVEEFRRPSTIPEAVLRFSVARSLDPARTLDEAYPVLRRLADARLLVSTVDDEGPAIVASLGAGDEIDDFTIVARVSLLEDTEVYQVRRADGVFGALKLARARDAARMRRLLAHEEAALRRLDGEVAPAVLGSGVVGGRRYLVTSWIAGVPVDVAGREAREAGDRRAIVALSAAVARAYARLHRVGVVHGDVHPGNVLVDAGGGVRLIDLGRAAIEGGGRRAAPGRAGVPFYFEPEYARAVLARRPAPTATRASEQYAVAALLYALATGGRHLDFSLEEQVSLRQIAREAPLPFAHHGRAPWPELEAVLGRALARSPGQRYPSMDRLADALAALSPKRAARARSGSEALPRLLDAFLVRVSPGGERYAEGVVEAPRSSVSLGAAGIGYALYRIALRREDPRLLPLADVWLSRARRGAAGDDGFVAPAIDLVAAKVGRHSVHHAGPGLAWAEALVALAMGSRAAAGAAARAFAEAAVAPGGEIDVSFGRAGLLLGAASLADAGCAEEVRAAGDALTAGIWETLDALAPVGGAPEMPSLGVAHGWAGVLFATLRWCAASGAAVPGGTAARVDELFALAEPWGRGVRFRRVLSPDPLSPRDYVSGWCNGTAGMVHLALAAHEVLGDPRFLDVAERCALGAWEHAEARADLCCGFGGRAYALLALHAAIGGRAWLERARGLSARAAAAIGEQSIRRESLYRGEAGIAVLAAEIDRPELAAMPLFAGEGWRGAPAAGGRGG